MAPDVGRGESNTVRDLTSRELGADFVERPAYIMTGLILAKWNPDLSRGVRSL